MTRGFNLFQKRKYQEGEPPAEPVTPPNNGGEGDPAPPKTSEGGGEPTPTPSEPKVSDREAELLKEVMKRKGHEQTLKGEVGKLQEQLKRFEGIDPEQVRSLLNEKVEHERAELEKRGEFDRVKQQIVDQHKGELDTVRSTYDTQVNELSQKLQGAESLITDLTIGRSFGDSPFVRETLTLTPSKARVVYGQHFEVQDGNVVAYDKPAGAADRTMLVNGEGNPLPFDKAIAKIVQADPDYEHLTRSKVKSGAGSKSEPGQQPTPKVGAGRSRISAAINGGALKQPAK